MQYDHETFRSGIAGLPCRQCGEIGQKDVRILADGPHFARINCGQCGAFVDWLSFPPERAAQRRRTRPRIRRGDARCELCLRAAQDLPLEKSLVEHHVDEHAMGGEDAPENTRVYCTACHALVHWLRTYFGQYHPYEPGENVPWISS